MATWKTRYTVMVQSCADESVVTMHGVFTDLTAATATAEQWQRVLDRRHGVDRIVAAVRVIRPASAAARDRVWGAE